ncbi:MAG: cytochrome c biogenesis protein ResB [Thiohalomonadaceae bacterium]
MAGFTNTPDYPRPRRSSAAILLEFLGSMNLAITLLVAISVAAIIGTVLQQNQPYPDYVRKFGPFWFEVFERLGLYDVYSAGWFLVLLGLLLVSTAVCVYRHAPIMLRDMRHFRLDVQDKSLRSFHQQAEWDAPGEVAAVSERAAAALAAQGYRVRTKAQAERTVVAGMRGSWNRLGYLLTHVAIVVICVGALIDGNLPLKLAERLGTVKVETRDLPANQIPPESTLAADNTAFRGSVRIPEGGQADFVFLNVRDGFLLQKLPFRIELVDFRVEHYPSGQPKSFESDLVIHDPELDEPLKRTIAVNHPLIYKGYAIYQASFSDGGSQLTLSARALDAPDLAPLELRGAVYQNLKVVTPRGPLTLELIDFKPYNVFPAEGDGKGFTNYGPSVVFKLRNEAGEAVEYLNYMAPVTLEGRLYFMSGMRNLPSEPYRYLYVPMDANGSLERFFALRGRMLDEARVRRTVADQADGLMPADADAATRANLVDSIVHLVGLFGRGGLDAVMNQVEKAVPEAERNQAMESYIMVLQSVIGALYVDQLREEGSLGKEGVAEADAQFFEDALEAFAALGSYGSPLLVQLTDFRHVEASGLQITRSPGKDIVYLGCVMLMAGVFFMFYLHHRRVWVAVTPGGQGARVLFAGSGNRDRAEFAKEFDGLHRVLAQATGAGEAKVQQEATQ